MRKTIEARRSQKGFTLLEVTITIVIAAIVGSFLIAFMGSAITNSYQPIVQAQNMATSEATMEKIAADYLSYLVGGTGSTSWVDLGSGYSITITNKTRSDISISGSAMTIPNFPVKEIKITVGDQTLIAYFMQ